MNSRVKRLKLLSRIAGHKTNIAARLLAEANQALEREQNKLSELEDYHEDYCKDMCKLTGQTKSTQQLQTYHSFLEHLEQVIWRQHNTITEINNELDKRRKLWQTCYNRQHALEKYREKVTDQIQQAKEVRDQRELDIDVTAHWIQNSDRST